jgi:protein-disulfide isomerase
MDSKNTFLSTPKAIILGSVIISVAILVSGGIIKIGPQKTVTTTNAPAPTLAAQQAPQQVTVTLAQVKDSFNKAQIKFGDANKKLVVLEIADPSCPFCAIAAGKNPELNKQAGSRFTLVSDGGTYQAPVPEFKKLIDSGSASFAYIYTPGHGNGEMGTKAMYCANERGKFWEAHDLIMSAKGYELLNNTVKNDKAKSQDVATFLASAVDSAFIKSCLDSGKYDNRLKEDVALATSLGVSGTPGFFLNATPFAGAYNYTDMESAIKTGLGQ